jgi:hypothetical protein
MVSKRNTASTGTRSRSAGRWAAVVGPGGWRPIPYCTLRPLRRCWACCRVLSGEDLRGVALLPATEPAPIAASGSWLHEPPLHHCQPSLLQSSPLAATSIVPHNLRSSPNTRGGKIQREKGPLAWECVHASVLGAQPRHQYMCGETNRIRNAQILGEF